MLSLTLFRFHLLHRVFFELKEMVEILQIEVQQYLLDASSILVVLRSVASHEVARVHSGPLWKSRR